MLTGDKLETAENIGISCKLIQSNFSVSRCSTSNHDEIDEFLKKVEKDVKKKKKDEKKMLGIVVEGSALTELLKKDFEKRFLKVALVCDSVIICRVTPKQKADVVRLIKKNTDKITLAIGDGANDVNMIQEAHIGIGLYGNEGLRAV